MCLKKKKIITCSTTAQKNTDGCIIDKNIKPTQIDDNEKKRIINHQKSPVNQPSISTIQKKRKSDST
jgi:hypothetical protein